MGIPYMTRKTKQNKVMVVPKKQPKEKQKPKTPFADAGEIVGKRLANMFGAPQLKGIGKWLGSGIGQIFGSGDYQMVGSSPEYNVLTNDRQIPKFTSTDRTNVVCHREYLGTITGSDGFLNREFRLNPGDDKTFPWLSTIATSYQEYRFHGLIFEFRSLLTDYVPNGAPGVTIFATNYNSTRPAYTSKIAMENSEFAVSTKPTVNMVHAIECKPSETVLERLYVRDSNDTTEDSKFYDLGKTQFATQGNPLVGGNPVMLGELWVSYCVEFFKPKLTDDIVGDVRSALIGRTTTSNANPLGTIQTLYKGDLDVTVTSTTVSVAASAGACYFVTINWNYVGAAAWVSPTVSFVNCTSKSPASYGWTFPATQQGPVVTYYTVQASSTLNVGDSISIVFDGAGTIPSSNPFIVVTEFSTAAIA